MAYLTAHEDPELLPWLLGIANGLPTPAGDFLRSLAYAALRADSGNYLILRPGLQLIRDKFPKYNDPEAKTA